MHVDCYAHSTEQQKPSFWSAATDWHENPLGQKFIESVVEHITTEQAEVLYKILSNGHRPKIIFEDPVTVAVKVVVVVELVAVVDVVAMMAGLQLSSHYVEVK